jgi:YfiH family protein
MMVDTRVPQPNGGFRWTQAGAGLALVCPALEPFAQHLFTTREWPLGSGGAPDEIGAWDDVARALATDPRDLVRVKQVHGARVVVHRSGDPRDPNRPPADIIVSDDPRAALAIQTADCVPLILVDRRTGAVAAAHAGWRGLAAQVPRVAVDALVRECDSRPADLVVAVGPCIGACCYEVGADVRDAFVASPDVSEIDRWFHEQPLAIELNPPMPGLPPRPRPAHWFFDSWAATRHQLEGAGVPSGQIHMAGLCTASHPDVFCSYRRDGTAAGRLAGAIRPRPVSP